METHSYDFNCKHYPRNCCCSSCKRIRCREDLCNHKFSIRLNGLEGSLTYRIYELLWSNVELELDSGNKIKGTLSFVGFNFVEIHSDKNGEERTHEKGQSSIVTIDKIMNIELMSS